MRNLDLTMALSTTEKATPAPNKKIFWTTFQMSDNLRTGTTSNTLPQKKETRAVWKWDTTFFAVECQRNQQPHLSPEERMAHSFSDSDLLGLKDSLSMNWVTTPDCIHISLCNNNINCGGTISQQGKFIPIPAHVSTVDGNYRITTHRNTKSSIRTCSGLGVLSIHRSSPSSQGRKRGIRRKSLTRQLQQHGWQTRPEVNWYPPRQQHSPGYWQCWHSIRQLIRRTWLSIVCLDISGKHLLVHLNFDEFFCQHWRHNKISGTRWGT